MEFHLNPFFWALVSMFGLVGACSAVGNKKLGKNPSFGVAIVSLFDLGRFMLVLPICSQPRFELAGWHWLIGGVIIAVGLIFCFPAFFIKPFTSPDENITLLTTGFYAVVNYLRLKQ